MCLIVFSFKEHADFPLVFAGNRDEFHSRRAASARFWERHPHLLAGRDLQAGGTWLGVTRDGRFATVTNFREPDPHVAKARSRGELVTDFLVRSVEPEPFLVRLRARAQQYGGFNLILGDARELYYFSNRNDVDRARRSAHGGGVGKAAVERDLLAIEAGLHGLSNERLDTPWPKVRRAKALFREIVAEGEPDIESLLELLADDMQPTEELLPSTGLDTEWERALSSIFITGEVYGTRASTVVLMRRDGRITFSERAYGPGGGETGTETVEFMVEP